MHQTQISGRGFAAIFNTTIACFAFLLMGMSAYAQPANNNFANATVIPASLPATVTGNNTGATSESGEPLHSDWPNTVEIGLNSIWWTWTPAASGAVAIDTVGSTIDTGLGVWTGIAVSSLNLVARNEDGNDENGIALQGGRSRVTFNAVAGTTYHIAVVGYDHLAGAVTVNITSSGTPPPPTGFRLTINTLGSGTVTKSPDKTSYDSNEVVTLTAAPTGTNTFLGWSDDAAAEGTNNPIQITMNASKTVSATFTTTAVTPSFNFSVSAIPSDALEKFEISPTPNSPFSGYYLSGTEITIKAIPKGMYHFHEWTGTIGSSTNPLTLVITNHLSLTAYFRPSLVIEPDFAEINEGEDFELVAHVFGSPLSYLWLHNGEVLHGETNQVLSLESALRDYAGTYKVIATTDSGVITSEPASLFVVPLAAEPMTLGRATGARFLDWRTGGDAPWEPDDSGYRVTSGIIEANQRSWIETTIVGSGTLGFFWSASSERYFDVLRVFLNGNQQASISGGSDWDQQFAIPAGTNVIRWEYSKDGTVDESLDRGKLGSVYYRPDPGVEQPVRMSSPRQLRNGNYRMTLSAVPGWINVETSTNLLDWLFIGKVANERDGVVVFEDRNAGKFRQRFYRATR